MEGRTGDIVPLTAVLLLSKHGITLSWGDGRVLTDANLFSACALMRVNRQLKPWNPGPCLGYLHSVQ